MLRVLFVALILLHGLIHLMGFGKAFGWGQFEQLTQEISKPKGVWWLTAAVLLISGGLLFLFRQPWWWMPGLAGALLSQVLIFQQWTDAWAGTIPNVLLLIVAVLGIGAWNFQRMVYRDLDQFWPPAEQATAVIQDADLADLPLPVQRWLRKAGVTGKPMASQVQLRQEGRMRTAPDGKWMKFTADQWFTVRSPAFLWYAKVGAGSPVRLNGEDLLRNGKGHMLIKLFGLVPIVDAQGPTIDQGTLLRYLAETVWFPSAALNDCIEWEAIDDRNARATLTQGDQSVDGVLTFSEEGLPIAFEALRYYDRDGKATLETWHIDMDEAAYREFAGVKIPTRSEVSWKLEEGDFHWLSLEIVAYETDGS